MSEKRRERMSQGRYCQSYYCNVIYFLIKKEVLLAKEKVLSMQAIIVTLTLGM